MSRKPNTNRHGGSWTPEEIKAVWEKGFTSNSTFPLDRIKFDKCLSPMKFSEHGNRQSEYGWEIDHINPVSNHGGDDLSNLQPLNWKNNAEKGDSTNWSCPKMEPEPPQKPTSGLFGGPKDLGFRGKYG